MAGLLYAAHRWLSRLEYLLVAGAAASIFVMMIVTSIDVVMRYAFDAPLSWSFDLIAHYLLRTAFLFGFAWCLSTGHHICVGFVARHLPGSAYHLFQTVGALGGAAIFGLAAWHGWHETLVAWEARDVFFGVVAWPAWPSNIIIPLGLFPLALRCIHLSIVHSGALFGMPTEGLLPDQFEHGMEEERL